MQILTNKMLRIPLLSIVAGIILKFVEIFITMPMYTGLRADLDPRYFEDPELFRAISNEVWTRMLLILFIVAIVLFLIIAIFCLRDMTKKEIAKSAAIVVIFEILRNVLTHIFIALGFVQGLQWVLGTLAQIPFEMYYGIHRIWWVIAINFNASDLFMLIANWPSQSFNISSLIAIMLPFVFVIFGKKEQRFFYSNYDWYLNAKE